MNHVSIKEDVAEAEYIFEITEPLLLKAVLPVSQKLRIAVKIGELSESEIENTVEEVRNLTAKRRNLISAELGKFEGIEKKLLEKLKSVNQREKPLQPKTTINRQLGGKE